MARNEVETLTKVKKMARALLFLFPLMALLSSIWIEWGPVRITTLSVTLIPLAVIGFARSKT